MQVFMGHCDYYRQFIYMYAAIAKPLYALLVVCKWIHKCKEAFEKLKYTLILALILRAPYWNEIVHVHVYFSAY